jgi:hypothetical protein
MTDDDVSGGDGLPRPVCTTREASARFVNHVSSLLIGLGWLSGAAVAVLALVSAHFIHQGAPQDIPFGLMEDRWPAFRDRATFSAVLVAAGGLVLALVPVIVVAGAGHLLRLFVGLDRGVRELLDRLGERS